MKKIIKKLDEDIDRYLDELDENDEMEPDEPKLTREELQEKIEEMKVRLKETQELERKRKERGESQISLTDPDSRSRPLGGGRTTVVGYNIQFSVDPKHKLILDHQVTNNVTDRDLLSDMAKRAKEILGVDQLEALADMGCYHGKEIKACLDEGITPYIPKPRTSASRKRGLFAKEDFQYDPEKVTCPPITDPGCKLGSVRKGGRTHAQKAIFLRANHPEAEGGGSAAQSGSNGTTSL